MLLLCPWLLATACIHSVIFPKLNYWTLFLNMVTFLCRVLGTFFVRSGLLTSVHSFATDSTRGIFLWFFFLNITSISLMFFFQMKRQSSTRLVGALSDLSLNQSLGAPKPVNQILWYSRRSTLFVHLRQFTRLSKLMGDEEGHNKLIVYKASKIHKEKKLFFSGQREKKLATFRIHTVKPLAFLSFVMRRLRAFQELWLRR